ncbi:hypothetical protein PPRY_a2674 [Pseudoalteromonas prydzensis ACAM 620]|nr:hypothetical protein [Pseudoalteromonas prydzensis ACAM 620]
MFDLDCLNCFPFKSHKFSYQLSAISYQLSAISYQLSKLWLYLEHKFKLFSINILLCVGSPRIY